MIDKVLSRFHTVILAELVGKIKRKGVELDELIDN